MSTNVEEIFREVNQLSPEERERLIALLAAQGRADEGHLTLEQLTAEQGTKPLRFEQLLGTPIPDEENDVDAFLAEVNQWRSHPSSRGID